MDLHDAQRQVLHNPHEANAFQIGVPLQVHLRNSARDAPDSGQNKQLRRHSDERRHFGFNQRRADSGGIKERGEGLGGPKE